MNRRNSFLLMILIVLSPLWTHAQFDIVSQKVFGGNRDASFGKYLKSHDGGYYFGFNSNVQTSGNITAQNHGPYFCVIQKYDENDHLEWEKSYGGSNNDALADWIEVADGVILMISSSSPIGGMKEVVDYGNNHAWIVKIDFEGEILWQQSFGGNETNGSRGILEDVNGNLYFGFSTNSPPSGTRTAPLKGYRDYWVVKTDSNGEIIWDKSYGSDDFDGLLEIDQLSDGRIVLLGNSTGGVSIDKSEPSISEIASGDIWVVTINSDGDLLWDRTLGAEGPHSMPTFKIVNDDIFIATTSNSNISGNRTVPLKGIIDIWFMKLDDEGQIVKQQSYGGSGMDGVSKIISLDDDHLLLFGGSASNASIDKSEDSRGGWDYWPIIINKHGDLVYEKTIGGDENDFLDGGMFLNNKIYLAGNTLSDISGDKTLPFFPKDFNDDFNRDIWIVKLDAGMLNLSEHEQNSFVVYPNPVSAFLNMDFNVLQSPSQIMVYSPDGKLLLHETISAGAQSHQLDFTAFPDGMYTIHFLSEEGIQMKKVVKGF
jgi:hypothetical protein